jgi:CRISPR type III-A-associated protein Csm2
MSNPREILGRYERGLQGGGGGGAKKTCRDCGKPLKNDRFDTRFDCSQKRKRGEGERMESLPPEYAARIEHGFFDEKGSLWEEFITTMASAVAKSFGRGLKNHQLRRFYGHAKDAENRLRNTKDWASVNLDIKKLSPFASEAKGKGKIPNAFYEFIEKNVSAVKSQRDFQQGFIPHFEAVVAFFTYHYPNN